MMDMMFLMNFIIIFTLFLAIGVLIVIFYQVIKIDFKKLREIAKEAPPKKEPPSEKPEAQKSAAESIEIASNQVSDDKIGEKNQVDEKQKAPELNKVDDVETLLKGASKGQEVKDEEELRSLVKETAEIKADQQDEKQSSKTAEEIVEKEAEQLSEVESLLKVEEIKPSDIKKQFMELNEYVKRLRDSLRSLKKYEED